MVNLDDSPRLAHLELAGTASADPASPSTPFTNDDWQGLMGAEAWDNDHPPLIRCHGENVSAIADAVGVQIWWHDPSGPYDEENSLFVSMKFPTQALAKIFLDGLDLSLTPLQFKDLGFESVLK